MKWFGVIFFLAMASVIARAQAPNVEYGEYLGQGTVHEGYAGYWTGTDQDQKFFSNGRMIYSSRGGWVSGYGPDAGGGVAYGEEEYRPRRRPTSPGQAPSVEYGEYISRGTVFGGHRGHWSGTDQDQRFINENGDIIFSSRGGWVRGYEPNENPSPSRGGSYGGRGHSGGGSYQPSRSPGALISQIDSGWQIHRMTADGRAFQRVYSLEPDRIYLAVNETQKMLTRSVVVGDRVRLELVPLQPGTTVTGKMNWMEGAAADWMIELKRNDGGAQWQYYTDPRAKTQISIRFVH